MKPDRLNYETWLIDWLDGTLTVQQTDVLMAFLNENPDIREEADSLMIARISPVNDAFAGKEKLLKSSAEITASQIEYLSASFLEGDLTPEQKDDLLQNIELNPASRELFDRIQKTKLDPPVVSYSHKNNLRRIALTSKITRLTVIGLSAAAVMVFLLLNHMFIPRQAAENIPLVAVITSDTIYIQQPIIIKDRNSGHYFPQIENNIIKAGTEIPAYAINDRSVQQNIPDSIAGMARIQGPDQITFTGMPDISLNSENISPALIVSTINFNEPVYDDERSRLDRFIARTFREKILKEKKAADVPLQSYEFAQAGIDGLNKLLGWQMALVKTNDEAGELKSVYFSSKVLKFNAPVRKTTELQ
jgi:hypothetical protein